MLESLDLCELIKSTFVCIVAKLTESSSLNRLNSEMYTFTELNKSVFYLIVHVLSWKMFAQCLSAEESDLCISTGFHH